MSEPHIQTVSGTVSAITREGDTVLLNWEAKASVEKGKETVHVHAWATDEADQAVPVYQFYGAVISPQLGDAGQFRSPFNRYLLHDRDRIFGQSFIEQVQAMGIKPVLCAPRSPWQRAYIKRVIGTLRRECLDHVIVFNQTSLSRPLRWFLDYYHHSRYHLALAKETPEPRPVQPPEDGRVISLPQIGGLHHRYERRAA